MSEYGVLAEISAWTSSAYMNGILLSGIIYLCNVNWAIMRDEAVRDLKTLQNLCGPSALQNVLLTTTQWSKANPLDGRSREETLRARCGWGELVTQGAAIERFLGTRESGLKLIHKLMKNEPKPLLIQHQIVNEAKALEETDAGKEMVSSFPHWRNLRKTRSA